MTAAWARLKFPIGFDVCNLGAGPAPVEVKLASFDFQRAKKPLGAKDAVSVSPESLVLGTRTCRTLTLRRGITPDPGEYAGVVVIRSKPKAGIASLIRRRLTVTFPAPDPPKPLMAAADEIVLSAKRNGPFRRSVELEEPASLPLAVRGSATAAPPQCSRRRGRTKKGGLLAGQAGFLGAGSASPVTGTCCGGVFPAYRRVRAMRAPVTVDGGAYDRRGGRRSRRARASRGC